METIRPLTGVKVIELAQMVAVPATCRFLADMGAEVIKIESPKGDGLCYVGPSEGRPLDDDENTTWDFENTGKKLVSLDLRTEKGREIFDKLLEDADILATNWRPQALARQNLTYDDLKEKYPKLVYAILTGYGEKGEDSELPGYDFTAFFARGGWSGSLYQKGSYPPNWVPGLGDHQAAMALAAGILAALHRSRTSGIGDKVSVNLLHTAIYMQSIPIQASQYYPNYGAAVYPIDRRDASMPLIPCAKTKDNRYIQTTSPQWERFYPTLLKIIDREDLLDEKDFQTVGGMHASGRCGEMYDIIQEAFAKKNLDEWIEILSQYDLPYAVCQTWPEVLADKQAWANDCFYEMDYPRGKKILIRTPVDFEDTPLPPFEKAGYVGRHTVEVLKGIGYDDDEIKGLIDEKIAFLPKA